MAGSRQIIRGELQEALGLRSTTIDRMLRPLRADGKVPMGEPGRGKDSGQYEPSHYAHFLIGTAGYQPSDAAEAVDALGPMVYASTTPETAEGPEDPSLTFSEVIAKGIDNAARAILAKKAGDEDTYAQLAWKVPRMVSMRLYAPRTAQVEWGTASGRRWRHSYVPAEVYSSRGGLYRETGFDHFPIWAAAALWADTLADRGNLPLLEPASSLAGPPSVSEDGVTTATPERETPEPHHRAPAPTHTDQTRANGTLSHTPKNKRESENSQGSLDSRRSDRTPSTSERSHGPAPNPHPASP